MVPKYTTSRRAGGTVDTQPAQCYYQFARTHKRGPGVTTR